MTALELIRTTDPKNKLNPYRRHTVNVCDYADKGQNFTNCNCPIWVDGKLNGERYRKSLDTNDWRDAEQRIQTLLRGDQLPTVNQGRVKLCAAVEQYYEYLRKIRRVQPSTVKLRGYALNPMVKYFPPEKPIASVTFEELEAFRLTRSHLEPGTDFREIVDIKTFFKWALNRKSLGVETPGPAKALTLPIVNAPPTMPYEPAEIQAMLQACSEIKARANEDTGYFRKRIYALVLLLLHSGLRIKDATFLKRSKLDVGERRLTLWTMKNNERVSIQLAPHVVEALITLPALNHEYFFWDGKSKRLDCIFRYCIERLGALAKVENAHPHRFRDTFACHLLLKGADIRRVQQLLGHKSLKTTEQHYTPWVNAYQDLLDETAALLDYSAKPTRPVLLKSVKKGLGNSKRRAG